MGDISQREQLLALSPVDGRYANTVDTLRPYLSEFGLIQARVEVMAGWVSMLGSGILPDRPPLPDYAQEYLRSGLHNGFTIDDALKIKEIEKKENHDVKAVELWITDQMKACEFDDYRTMVHFGCTSEDVNASAYALALKRARDEVMLPKIGSLTDVLDRYATEWADIPLLGMTHGQAAVPSTLGKEMRVYNERFVNHMAELGRAKVFAKFGGATGGYNAMMFAFPGVSWHQVTNEFVVDRLGVQKSQVTTQIESHDWISRLCGELTTGASVLQDLDVDVWLYITRGVIKQIPNKDETGSSTMPNKVNPIDVENSEGNSDVSIALLQMLARTLPRSRMQRDLSDSTRLRNLGPALGHYYVALNSTIRMFGKVEVNDGKLEQELDSNWAVLTEAVQTKMRVLGITGAYQRIKEASRGLEFNETDYRSLVESLITEMPEEAIVELLELTPDTYTGLSADLAKGI